MLILEKRKIGEFREHNEKQDGVVGRGGENKKLRETLRKILGPHRQDNREGNEEVKNAEEKEKLGAKAICHLSLVAYSCHNPFLFLSVVLIDREVSSEDF